MYEVDRCRRVSELIRRELATLLRREVDDHRVKMVAITAVTVSKDLKQATVYVSRADAGLASPAEQNHPPATPAEIEKTLNHAGKYLRYLLGQQLDLRVTPGLLFKYDDSIRHGAEMSMLIDSLNKKHGAE